MKTFIVRVWIPAEDRSDDLIIGELHGTVHNAATGEEARFANDDSLLQAVRSFLADIRPRAAP